MFSARIAIRLPCSFMNTSLSGFARGLGEERADERAHVPAAALRTGRSVGVLAHGLGHADFLLTRVAEELVERHGFLLPGRWEHRRWLRDRPAYHAPGSATSLAAAIPASAHASSLSETSPEMPTAPMTAPPPSLMSTPPAAGTTRPSDMALSAEKKACCWGPCSATRFWPGCASRAPCRARPTPCRWRS